ncbi:adenylate/guanylate cyclase domain-containing protein [Azospirillum sp. YIM DDC1]|uniref:Adenylate/guanylate cyclase domain-containing protein n=1 Tax=Azospirillum aestuarii TaxID=2802052 RepID=A0ABS1I7G5_9PROT|nr:adenylate/guanylate cyclase domain-containing protein [Azospirillum aestuarii]MBK4722854.1 adenylate/guanylate cyclase domain-containing protein [Azospirillum aestuarii]
MSQTPYRIRLRVGIALVFLLTTVPLIAVMLSYLYHENSRSALEVASQSIARTTQTVINDLNGLVSPVARVAEAMAGFGRIDRNGLRRIESLRYFSDALATLPQLASLYVGFAGDGAFFQMARLAPDGGRFGPATPPPGSALALRMQDSSSGRFADSYFYLRSWGQVTGVERAEATEDPRTAPWYVAAQKVGAAVMSDAFVLPATRRPVVTVSYRMATDDGVPIGTIGADVSLDRLAARLDALRIGPSGAVFVIDGRGRVICHNRADLLVGGDGATAALHTTASFPDPVLAEAVERRSGGAGDRFIAPLGPMGRDYIIEFATLADGIGSGWTVGVAVEVDEFVGSIRRATYRIVVIGTGLLAVSVLLLLWLSHRLTRPMQDIVSETKRIRHFDLNGRFAVRTRVQEVAELAGAVEAMKGGLRRFGAYVPKALVRDIIVTGDGGELGGETRPLSILFSDIAGFTATSEAMPPQQVLDRLTTYFERMTACIHGHGGTVDKFIGDAIMAFWNAPRPDPDHVEHACLAALGCLSVNRAINDACLAAGMPPMPTRFGLHLGEVVVGNVGSSDRMQYTALGSHVNLASRIEGLNKVYGTSILVTGAVEQAVRGRFLFRPVDLAVPSGLSAPIELFELVGALDPHSAFARPPETHDLCRQWHVAVSLYRGRRWSAALDLLRPLADEPEVAALARLYVARCERLIADPPGDGWDPAEHFKSK